MLLDENVKKVHKRKYIKESTQKVQKRKYSKENNNRYRFKSLNHDKPLSVEQHFYQTDDVSYIVPLDKQRKTRKYINISFIFLFFDGDVCVK